MSATQIQADVHKLIDEWREYRDDFAARNALAHSPLALQQGKLADINDFSKAINAYSVRLREALDITSDSQAEALGELVVNIRGAVFGVNHM